MGVSARAISGMAVSIGSGNVATGNGAVAIGGPNIATGTGAVALGNNNTAIGQGAVAIGSAASTYSLPGIASGASLAAQSGALRLVTSDRAGNLGVSAIDLVQVGALNGRVTSLEGGIAALLTSQALVDRRASGGIAATAALSGTMVAPDSTISMSFNLATYRGQHGFSGTVVARASERLYISAGVAGSTVRGSTVGRVGRTARSS